jgi:hypothetical protein
MKMKVYVVTATSAVKCGNFDMILTNVHCVFATQDAANEYCLNINFTSKRSGTYCWKEVDFIEGSK